MNSSSCTPWNAVAGIFNATVDTYEGSVCNFAIEPLAADATSTADLTWLWRTLAATSCWAISDVICDGCIRPASADAAGSAREKEDRPGPMTPDSSSRMAAPTKVSKASGARQRKSSVNRKEKQVASNQEVLEQRPPVAPGGERLTPEQNALVSGLVALVVVLVNSGGVSSYVGGPSRPLWGSESMSEPDLLAAMALLGGCFHFTAYLATLSAFGAASSTVITPLMQLSAVWMLPLSISTATIGLAGFIRPMHLAAIALICAGGFLPAADGSLSTLATKGFWKQRAVRYVALGEFLICCYNIILHQATYGAQDDDNSGSVRFFLVSRLGNGLTCVLLFLALPRLRCHLYGMCQVGRGFLLTAVFGECLSLAGVCLVTFSYSEFYEPSVVNAVEGGLQQLLNLLFALLSSKLLGWGRDVSQVPIKILSLTLVTAGLTLTTM